MVFGLMLLIASIGYQLYVASGMVGLGSRGGSWSDNYARELKLFAMILEYSFGPWVMNEGRVGFVCFVVFFVVCLAMVLLPPLGHVSESSGSVEGVWRGYDSIASTDDSLAAVGDRERGRIHMFVVLERQMSRALAHEAGIMRRDTSRSWGDIAALMIQPTRRNATHLDEDQEEVSATTSTQSPPREIFCLETACLLMEAAYQTYFPINFHNGGAGVASPVRGQHTGEIEQTKKQRGEIEQTKNVGPTLDLSRLGLRLSGVFENVEHATFGVIGSAPDRLVIAFRGTVAGNVIADLKMQQVALPQLAVDQIFFDNVASNAINGQLHSINGQLHCGDQGSISTNPFADGDDEFGDESSEVLKRTKRPPRRYPSQATGEADTEPSTSVDVNSVIASPSSHSSFVSLAMGEVRGQGQGQDSTPALHFFPRIGPSPAGAPFDSDNDDNPVKRQELQVPKGEDSMLTRMRDFVSTLPLLKNTLPRVHAGQLNDRLNMTVLVTIMLKDDMMIFITMLLS